MDKWTIMVYIAADNVLANFAVESLKDLRDTAGDGIVVAAQWDLDVQLKQRPIKRRVFNGIGDANTRLDDNTEPLGEFSSQDMADRKTLKDFITWVYGDPRCKAKNYCLILWGHGPELFFEAATSKRKSVYLTPVELRWALGEAYPEAKAAAEKEAREVPPKLAIIGMDACSMSTIEFACELQGLADYMVASQEEVPDMSFPYRTLLQAFRDGKDIVEMCKLGAKTYTSAYEDYVFNTSTGVKQVTVSALRLAHLKDITDAITLLAQKLTLSINDAEMRAAILASRVNAKGFVAGLFVDLYDFCMALKGDSRSKEAWAASQAVCDAIDAQGEKAGIVIARGPRSHGLSIYFPYLTNDEKKQIDVTLVKGGLDTGNKGGLDTLNKAGADVLMDVRKKMIQDMERQYEDLIVFETGWYKFIANDWSRILAENGPYDLDVRYSSQQCFWNLLDRRFQAAGKPARSGA